LKVQYPDPATENLLWRLYLSYEDCLQLNDPIDPELELGADEEKEIKDMEIAMIESANKLHVFRTDVRLKKERQTPPSPSININMNLQVPPGVQPQQLPVQIQQVIQQMVGQLQQQVAQLVSQEIIRQSPLKAIGGRAYGGRWVPVA
jgi:hypothetical protein